MRLYHILLVPVLATATLTIVACKEAKGPSTSKSAIYTYELNGKYANGSKKKIGARYEYGTRASRMSSNSGTVKTKLTTAGPKNVVINVTTDDNLTVNCQIVVKRDGKKIAAIDNSGKRSTTCTFNP